MDDESRLKLGPDVKLAFREFGDNVFLLPRLIDRRRSRMAKVVVELDQALRYAVGIRY